MCIVDASSLLGGLLLTWNPRKAIPSLFNISTGILLEGMAVDVPKDFALINCYVSYLDHRSFWEKVEKDGFLNFPNLILWVI